MNLGVFHKRLCFKTALLFLVRIGFFFSFSNMYIFFFFVESFTLIATNVRWSVDGIVCVYAVLEVECVTDESLTDLSRLAVLTYIIVYCVDVFCAVVFITTHTGHNG